MNVPIDRTSVASRLSGCFAAVALALAACSGPGATGYHDTSGGFSEYAAREVFSDAYNHVQDRYIEQVSVERIALAGMKELSMLDDKLRIDTDGRNVQLASASGTVSTWPQPSAHDTGGWGRLTAEIVREGRKASQTLRDRDPESVYATVFGGVLKPLDDYSRYTDSRSADQTRAAREGFGGLGVTISTDENGTRVLNVLPDTPAEAGGIEAEDLITHVNGRPLAGLDRFDVVELLRGPVGSRALVTVERGEPPRTLNLEMRRAHVVPRTVLFEPREEVAYFRVTSFNRRTAYDLREAILEADETLGEHLGGIVLDLRSNPGGLLDQAIAAADLFLPEGIIISTRGRHPASNSAFAATRSEVAAGVPMVLLVNGRSASASEMMAAALQDHGRAAVIGSTTHGKGSVQNVATMPNGGELIVTWSRMHTPSGYIFDHLGVLPGICTSRGDADPLEQRRGGRHDIYDLVAQWHDYTDHDPSMARTLRTHCPPKDVEEHEDLELALTVLAQPALYDATLRPWQPSSMVWQKASRSQALH